MESQHHVVFRVVSRQGRVDELSLQSEIGALDFVIRTGVPSRHVVFSHTSFSNNILFNTRRRDRVLVWGSGRE